MNRLPPTIAAAAVLGIAASPAMTATTATGTLVEICAGHGSKWVRLPAGEPSPAPDNRAELSGCAHLVCPRRDGLVRGRGAKRVA